MPVLRLLHRTLRRHLETIEHALVAAGLTGLLYGLFSGLPVYPADWDAVILGAVFIAALWSPAGAYFLAVAVALYPFYTLSLYIVVLFIIIAVLGQHIFIQNLGATVLVLATPWLGTYHLVWVVPLLGGLWWGKAGGIWIGLGAALWGQIIAGMSGLSPDWLMLLENTPNISGVIERFGNANSLKTLQLILEPLTPDATTLLYYLLQIFIWALIGGLVGGINDHDWVQKRSPWRSILVGIAGVIILGIMHVGLGLWMYGYTLKIFAPLWRSLFLTVLMTITLISILEILLNFLEHPLPPLANRQTSIRPTAPVSEYPPLPVPSGIQKSVANETNNDKDLIMLELD